MTVQVERSFLVDAPREAVWEFIADPGKRAGAISVVDSYELHDEEGRRATWRVRLPIPFVRSTVAVETRDVDRREPAFVRFVGESAALRVTGEHELDERDGRTVLANRFLVDGSLPGVERFFSRNLERELDNLADAIRADLGADVTDA